jgi:hypothetical protein
MATKKQTVWETLSSDKEYKNHTEEKQAGKITLTYLSWAWAWNFVKKHYPSAKFTKHLFEVSSDDATYTIPYLVDKTGYAYVQVTVSIDSEEVTEVFPVLNYANKPVQKPNSFDVNTAHQRCLVKCLAYMGLGLDLYAGEDLDPEEEDSPATPEEAPEEQPVPEEAKKSVVEKATEFVEEVEGTFEGFKEAKLVVGEGELSCSADGNMIVPEPCITFDPSIVEQWVTWWVTKYLDKAQTADDVTNFFEKNKNIFSKKGLVAKQLPKLVDQVKSQLTTRVEELS